MKKLAILTTLLLAVFLIVACGAESPAEEPAAPAEPVTIRIAALPVLDTLPIYVAQEEGLFEQYNLTVEAIPASSAPKRDELINVAQADGMINEVMSTIFHNREQTRVQIVRYGRIEVVN